VLVLLDTATGPLIAGSIVGTPVLLTAAGGALFGLAALAADLDSPGSTTPPDAGTDRDRSRVRQAGVSSGRRSRLPIVRER
jgi:hypothetical protein